MLKQLIETAKNKQKTNKKKFGGLERWFSVKSMYRSFREPDQFPTPCQVAHNYL